MMAARREGRLQLRRIGFEVTNTILSQFKSAFSRGMIVMDHGPHLNGQAYGELVQSLLPQVEAARGR